MVVGSSKGNGMLHADCGNPEIILRNGTPFLLQLQANPGIYLSRIQIDPDYATAVRQMGYPFQIGFGFLGIQGTKTQFTDDRHRQVDFSESLYFTCFVCTIENGDSLIGIESYLIPIHVDLPFRIHPR